LVLFYVFFVRKILTPVLYKPLPKTYVEYNITLGEIAQHKHMQTKEKWNIYDFIKFSAQNIDKQTGFLSSEDEGLVEYTHLGLGINPNMLGSSIGEEIQYSPKHKQSEKLYLRSQKRLKSLKFSANYFFRHENEVASVILLNANNDKVDSLIIKSNSFNGKYNSRTYQFKNEQVYHIMFESLPYMNDPNNQGKSNMSSDYLLHSVTLGIMDDEPNNQ